MFRDLREFSIANLIVFAVIGAPSRTKLCPSPVTLVAITSSLRRPFIPGHSPITRSVSPDVSALIGFVGYISAVSIKLIPLASAVSI